MTAFDLTESIAPRSDQLNAEDLLTGPRTFTIAEVKRGTPEQPVDVHLVEFPGRPFKPSKTVRRIMVTAWGPDASTYAGRRMTLYRDPAVRFGGQDVGGIRVSHLSHIEKPLTIVLAVSKGKRAPYKVEPLPKDAPGSEPPPTYLADARAAKTLDEWRSVWQRASDAGHLTPALKAELVPLGEALKPKSDAEQVAGIVGANQARVRRSIQEGEEAIASGAPLVTLDEVVPPHDEWPDVPPIPGTES